MCVTQALREADDDCESAVVTGRKSKPRLSPECGGPLVAQICAEHERHGPVPSPGMQGVSIARSS